MAIYKGGIHTNLLTEDYFDIKQIVDQTVLMTIIRAWSGFLESGGVRDNTIGIVQDKQEQFWVVYGDSKPAKEFSLYGYLLSKLEGNQAFPSAVDIILKYVTQEGYDPLDGPDDSSVTDKTPLVEVPQVSYENPVEIQHTPSPISYEEEIPSVIIEDDIDSGLDYEDEDDEESLPPTPSPVVSTPLVLPTVSPVAPTPPVLPTVSPVAPTIPEAPRVVAQEDQPWQHVSTGYADTGEFEAATGFLGDDSSEVKIEIVNLESHDRYSIGESITILGRSSNSSDYVISVDNSVSRKHCSFQVVRGQLVVTDLGSANGTFVGSVRLTPETPTICPPRSLIKMGRVPLTVEDYS